MARGRAKPLAKMYGSIAAILLGAAAMTGALPAAADQGVANTRALTAQANALITRSNAAIAAKEWQAAADALSRLITLDPRWVYFQEQGNALLSLGQYEDALTAYDRGLAGVSADPNTPIDGKNLAMGQMLINKGNAYLKMKRSDNALGAYTQAAKLSTDPGIAYFNLCVTEYNLGKMDIAVTSCQAAIKADPAKADAYFIMGSALYGNGTLDKSNSYVVPAGTVEALQTYLRLAPNGGHITDVRAMLDALQPPAKP